MHVKVAPVEAPLGAAVGTGLARFGVRDEGRPGVGSEVWSEVGFAGAFVLRRAVASRGVLGGVAAREIRWGAVAPGVPLGSIATSTAGKEEETEGEGRRAHAGACPALRGGSVEVAPYERGTPAPTAEGQSAHEVHLRASAG